MTVTKKKEEKFEISLERLEVVVRKLEDGDLPLEGSLKAFEEGMALVKKCEARLNEARKKIEILMKERDGKKTIRDLDLEG